MLKPFDLQALSIFLCIKVALVTDPACGTSGFLVAAGDYLKENKKSEVFFNRENREHYMNEMFTGFDMDRTMLRIGAMNMMTHGVENPFIEYRDSLSDQNPDRERYSLILAIIRSRILPVCNVQDEADEGLAA